MAEINRFTFPFQTEWLRHCFHNSIPLKYMQSINLYLQPHFLLKFRRCSTYVQWNIRGFMQGSFELNDIVLTNVNKWLSFWSELPLNGGCPFTSNACPGNSNGTTGQRKLSLNLPAAWPEILGNERERERESDWLYYRSPFNFSCDLLVDLLK